MAVKPWPQITTMQEAVEYIAAELAETKHCSASAPLYQAALTQATSYASAAEITGTSEDQWAAVEASLNNARAAWKSAGCTKPAKGGGSTTSPEPSSSGEQEGPPYNPAGVVGGGIGTLLLLAAGGLAIYLIYGKKGKGGKRSSRKSSRRRR